MTNEQINIAIAEFCGWKQCQHCAEHGLKTWRYPTDDGCTDALPNYTSDLNAMHEAEVVIIKSGYTAIRTYEDLLQKQIANIIFATAAQRAEAFLRTLNLWIE
jgi:hypothetical protein